MKNFLNKEIRLCLAPINYVYLSFACMAIIPNYPRYVPFYFMCVSLLHLFSNAMFNKDIEYSMILPITKKEIVKSRCILVATYQILFTILTVPFSILYTLFVPMANDSGIEGNVAFYGLCLILMAIFTFVFFSSYYKKAGKPGPAFLKSTIIFWVLYFVLEMPVWVSKEFNIEFLKMLDRTDAASQIKQLPILAAGIVIYAIGWIFTYKISAKRFEKVDL